jgi:tetratricopeptide (TPR) repeat protein
VAVVDAQGRVATHTGERCIAHAGHQAGEHFSAQANMMASPEVWPAMAQAFERAAGPLQRRLAAALHAAEANGGDARGRQSAAILVAPAAGEPWRTTVDLRVDDDPEPLHELDRLLDLHDAYDLASEGDDLTGAGRHEEAGDRYERASALAPGNHELLFWAGLAAAQTGDLPTALQRVRRAIELQPGWAELLDRLEPDIAPGRGRGRARGALTGEDWVEEVVALPGGGDLVVARPRDAAALLDEERFAAEDEFLPVLGDLWPSARALAGSWPGGGSGGCGSSSSAAAWACRASSPPTAARARARRTGRRRPWRPRRPTRGATGSRWRASWWTGAPPTRSWRARPGTS